MKKLLLLVHLTVGLTSLVTAQIPKKIHDLKSLTDSSGTVHLFYRIYAEYEDTEYFTDNIYHYNTETGEEELFLEDFYDTHLGFEYQIIINGYKFFENNPSKFIYFSSDNEGGGFIERYDTTAFEGGLVFPMHIEVTGTDSSLVYGTFLGYGTFKSLDGGVTWPDEETIREENVPDSLKLNLPLVALSPYDDSLMFGVRLRYAANDNAFLRSTDSGKTVEVISDTLYPNKDKVVFGADSHHVYLIDTIGLPGSSKNCSIDPCSYGFYKSSEKGTSESWELKKVFNTQTEIEVTRLEQGEVYVWDTDTIFVSDNFGETFEVLFHSETENITGMTVEGDDLFLSTTSSLYKFENGSLDLVRKIPVGIEHAHSIPNNIQLHQNYPNPFNPSTVIRFELLQPTHVSLKIYDVVGNLVQTLVSEGAHPAGEHRYTWNAGSHISSGVYFYKLQTSRETVTKKMILIK